MKNKEAKFPVVAEIQLSYRPDVKPSQRPKVSSAKEVYHILKMSWDENLIELQEQFKIIFLNRANRILGIVEISRGGIYNTLVDPKLVFSSALKAGSSNIILVHNHPSGTLVPSPEDIKLTGKLVKCGLLLDIPILDHLIISAEGYYSFNNNGILPPQ
ncbi:JAB domain-containing protein [Pedobacter antarcticus]|uniref:JAB domain-containing protein n=1 Tax=Pedobacter antarcticus TaxID=34086 RepID=UPI002931F509|nr:JAB domain-containing protein [Pedobacter antarcticus]